MLFPPSVVLGSRIGRQPNSVKHQTLLELASIRGKEALTSPTAQVSAAHCEMLIVI